MPVDPHTAIPGYSFDGEKLIFPISAFPHLARSDAHNTRGDWRELFFSLSDLLVSSYEEMTPRPESFTVFPTYQRPIAEDSSGIMRTYTFKFSSTVSLSGPHVASE